MKKVILALGLASILISCGPGKKSDSQVNLGDFKQEWNSDKPAIEGQTFKIGVPSDSPFKGLLDPSLYTENLDSTFLGPISESLFFTDEDYQYMDGGMANMKIDTENKTVTYILRDGLKWSDGEPLTVDDIIFTYELIAHPDYTGVRYSNDMRNIIGMNEYHEGKAKTISGLEKVSDTELVVHFNELSTGLLTLGGGLVTSLSPKHYLQDIPVKDLEKNERVRTKPLSNSAYKIKQVVPGESIEYEVNEYYWDKENAPQVKNLIIKILPSSSTLTSIKMGEYDTYAGIPSTIIEELKTLDNIEILGKPSLSYYYIGFNLGKYDEKLGKNVYDETKKTADINLRKAMTYALNIEDVTKVLYKGLRVRANGVIPPAFKSYYDSEIGKMNYDPEKAKQLLDEAGYKDVDGDGIREDKNGKPLVLYYAQSNGGEIAEPLANLFLQNWKDVGLNVELTNGRLLDGSNFFETVEQNGDNVDIFFGGWYVGTSFNIGNLYSENAKFNSSRYSTPENEKLIKAVDNPEFLNNPSLKAEKVKEWHKYYVDNILGFSPIMFTLEVKPVNKRVKRYGLYTGDNIRYPLQLTETEPLKSTK